MTAYDRGDVVPVSFVFSDESGKNFARLSIVLMRATRVVK